MMTMEPEKRMHVYNVIQAYNRLMECHHSRSVWFFATVMGSSSLTGEMQVKITGGSIVDAPEGTILDDASEVIRHQIIAEVVGVETMSNVPAVMTEWVRRGNLFVHITGVIPERAVVRVQLSRIIDDCEQSGISWEVVNIGLPMKSARGETLKIYDFQLDERTPVGNDSIRRILKDFMPRSRLPMLGMHKRINEHRAQSTFSSLVSLKSWTKEKEVIWNYPSNDDNDSSNIESWIMDDVQTGKGVGPKRQEFLDGLTKLVNEGARLCRVEFKKDLTCLQRRNLMMAAFEKRGLIDEVFNMCETTQQFVYVDDTRVGVDKNAPSQDLPRPPTSKGRDDWPRKGKGKGKQSGYAYMDRNEAGYGGNDWNWAGNHSAHSSSWNGDWKY